MSVPSGSLVAGIDVGNSSTEVVLARVQSGRVVVIGAARAPTRRAKGSDQSLDGAVALVRRLEREHGVRIDRAVAAWLRPVETLTTTIAEAESSTGRLRLAGSSATTAGGQGFAVGTPYLLGDLDQAGDSARSQSDPLVAVVPAGMGYQAAVRRLRRPEVAGLVVAVVLADDEAVLVANRLGARMPVVDEVDVAAVLRAERVAVEVAAPGAALRTLTDPLRLVTALDLAEGERIDAARLARRLHDCANAVVTVDARQDAPIETSSSLRESPAPLESWVRISRAGLLTFPVAHRRIVAGMVGSASEYALNRMPRVVEDLWTVDLSAVADTVVARRAAPDEAPGASRAIGIAALTADAPLSDPSGMLAERLGVPVSVAVEARAAWAGGVSTPGAVGATVVIDLGGGTVDAVSADAAVVAAGGGQLLTVCVAALTGSSCAVAEWVKRGPAQRVETPQLSLGEDGVRGFLDRPAPAETLGWLVVDGPAGKLAFNRTMAPGEWRALRLRLKMECLGANVLRALRTLDADPHASLKVATVIVVGGPAGDEEVLSGLARVLPEGVAIGRGNVGGVLGHRYAVAYGLLALLAEG